MKKYQSKIHLDFYGFYATNHQYNSILYTPLSFESRLDSRIYNLHPPGLI